MGCSNVSTGFFRPGSQAGTASQLQAVPGRVSLFTPESPAEEIFSPTFTVDVGNMALIEAYNMPSDFPIYVNRVVRANFIPPTVSSCPPSNMAAFPGRDGIIISRERMTLGGSQLQWQLNKNSTDSSLSILQLMIAIPGVYELELSSEDMLGELLVEFILWDSRLTRGLPDAYFAGIL